MTNGRRGQPVRAQERRPGQRDRHTDDLSLDMYADATVTAVFVSDDWVVVTVGVQSEGEVTPSRSKHAYERGQSVAFVATPAADWMFDHWDVLK